MERDLLAEAANEIRVLRERVADLESAVVNHRLRVGEGYHTGSYRTAHGANVALWALVRPEPSGLFTGAWSMPEPGGEAGLERPALLEDDDDTDGVAPHPRHDGSM